MMGFFGKFGDEIEFKNKDEFYEKFNEVDCSVSEKKSTDEKERYVVNEFLRFLYGSDEITSDLCLSKSEQPDFIITQNSKRVGIEIVEAAHEQYNEAKAYARKTTKDHYPINTYFKHDIKIPKKKLSKTFQNPNESLKGPPSIGNQGVIENIKGLINTLNKKLTLLNKCEFQNLAEIELLIYMNLPSDIYTSVDGFLNSIGPEFFETNNMIFKKYYSKIHILKSYYLIYDAFSQQPQVYNRRPAKLVLVSNNGYDDKYNKLIESIVEIKYKLICIVGKECDIWKDVIDEYIAASPDGTEGITTTSHRDESIDDVISFAENFDIGWYSNVDVDYVEWEL